MASAALSRYHAEHPYVSALETWKIQSAVFARGVRHRDVRRQFELAWSNLMPVNALIIRALFAILRLLWE